MSVPKLRFHEFTESYITKTLSEIVDRVKRKNSENQTDIPLTIASIEGLVDQRTYFGRAVASKDMSGYYLLKNGEFAYNKSYSKGYPVGSIKRLDKYEKGALSTLYICFSLKKEADVDSEYLMQYFNSPAWYEAVSEICAEGARNHGLLNVSPDDFFATLHHFAPSKKEQLKIAKFLSNYDKKIIIQMRKVEALEKRNTGLMQKIFSQEIRFKSDEGNEFLDWEENLLSDILIERKGKSTGKEEVYSVSVAKGLVNQVEHLGRSFAAEDTSKYKVVVPGDVVYTKSPTGEFKWGIVKQSTIDKNVIVSPLYGIFIPKNKELGYIIDAYFSSSIRAHNYLITQIRKGAKNTINISNDEFLEKEICLPTDIEEQKKICEIINLLKQQVEIEKKKLESMKDVKKGLLQQLFI